MQVDVAQVVAVDPHRAGVGVVVAADELRERRLAAPGLADEREAPARPARNVDAVEHRLLAVREDDRVEIEVAVDPRQRLAPGFVVDLRLLVEDARDLHHRRARRLQLPVDVRELLQRLEDELQQPGRGDQRPDRERAVRRAASSRARARATVAITPRNSIDGKKTEKIFWT